MRPYLKLIKAFLLSHGERNSPLYEEAESATTERIALLSALQECANVLINREATPADRETVAVFARAALAKAEESS